MHLLAELLAGRLYVEAASEDARQGSRTRLTVDYQRRVSRTVCHLELGDCEDQGGVDAALGVKPERPAELSDDRRRVAPRLRRVVAAGVGDLCSVEEGSRLACDVGPHRFIDGCILALEDGSQGAIADRPEQCGSSLGGVQARRSRARRGG